MNNTVNATRQRLFELGEEKYRDFTAKLIPNVDRDTIIGVRTPLVRKLAAELSKTPEAEAFLKSLPHHYFDENNLHGFLIERIKDFDTCIKALDEFLPYVDNWATCDQMRPKVFSKHKAELIIHLERWLRSGETYTVRFAIEMLMSFYLDDSFDIRYPQLVAQVKSEEYYVRMMQAWYFATALAKQYDSVLPFIESRRLEAWTHNKAIQKAVESNRITPEQKNYLRTLKIK